ncbi:VOC family protein [Paenibacillus marchantiophytorum]|uniref:VOC family protein n=1 Tax=Paenibacillus marchantiophytorum TaxID=1619310 RepID=A0ABQ1F6X9_9BACL|nr:MULTISPECIES: glyoxalase/bleomycin resistance/extradiol dioxygenase family protein [Paenibacillus]UKS30512.1 glyoxalase/bleomycin resistance/extradiol dioxygenase family protein [Paenibacillus sp. HWE-109]GGA01471.1 VOC family protein [Paenibacillus marchantiophytorum]
MSLDAYLNFNGNCREVVEFYAEVFGLEKPHIISFGDGPQNPDYPIPEEAKNLVMHARLSISGSTLMFSDTFPGMPYIVGNNISLSLVSPNLVEVQSAFHKLKEGGNIRMELQETSWSKCYGNLEDKFGIQWQFNLDSGETY